MELRAKARLAGRVVLILTCAALFSCAGAKSELAISGAGPFAGLPTIPLDVPGHLVSDVHNAHINGKDTLARSAGAITSGNGLLLFTSEGQHPPELEWGLYRYVPDSAQSEVVSSVTLDFDVNAGPNGWIAVANYGTGTWEFKGPFNQGGGGGSKTFDNLNLGSYTSPAGNLYFLAAAYDGSTITVNGMDITSDITPVQTFTISGTVTDSTTGDPLVDVTVRLGLPANLTTSTDNNGNYSFTGLAAGSYTVSADNYPGYDPFGPPAYPISFPGDPGTGKDFSANLSGPPDVTYETGAAIMKSKIDTYCVRCHQPGGSASPWPLRTYAEIQGVGFANVVFQVTNGGNNSSMPQAGSPEKTAINNASDRHWFTDWENNTPAYKQ